MAGSAPAERGMTTPEPRCEKQRRVSPVTAAIKRRISVSDAGCASRVEPWDSLMLSHPCIQTGVGFFVVWRSTPKPSP